MSIKLQVPKLTDLRPRIAVIGVGGAGGNAVNNMIAAGLAGVDFMVANTDAQALLASQAPTRIQLGTNLTEGLGAGSKPEIGQAAAEEAEEELRQRLDGAHMLFIAAGMGGGTGTGAAAVIARVARGLGILTVAVVTKPFRFEGSRRHRIADAGVKELKPQVDTLIVIPNENLFKIANEQTTFAEAFVLADQVLYSGIACIVDLIIKEGLINLDLADVRTVLTGMGSAVMGMGEGSGERRAVAAAEQAISNPLLGDVSLTGAKGLLISIVGGRQLTLYEVDEAASRVRQEVDPEANIIVGATFDESLGDKVRVSIVASGMDRIEAVTAPTVPFSSLTASTAQAVHETAAVSEVAPPTTAPTPVAITAAPPTQSEPELPLAPMARVPVSHTLQRPTAPALPLAQTGSSTVPETSDHRPPAMARSLGVPPPLPPNASIDPAPLAAQSPASVGLWTSNDAVVVHEHPRETAVQIAAAHATPPLHAGESVYANQAGPFVPQSPIEVRRAQRRMPDVDDFPAIGQKEYRAKTTRGADADAPTPVVAPALADSSTDPKKGTLYQRLKNAALGRPAVTDPAPPSRESIRDGSENSVRRAGK